MSFNFVFFLNSLLLGIGLAMDAFSVSVANGLKDYQMSRKKICLIAGTFAFFQALMPLLGWFCVHSLIQYFHIMNSLLFFLKKDAEENKKTYVVSIPDSLFEKDKKLEKIIGMFDDGHAKNSVLFLLTLDTVNNNKKIVKKFIKNGFRKTRQRIL